MFLERNFLCGRNNENMAGITLGYIKAFLFTSVQHEGLASGHVIGDPYELTRINQPFPHK